MRRMVRWFGLVVVVLLLALLSLPFLIDANQFRPMLESSLTGALGREVKLGDLKLAILKGGVTAGDLSVADDPAFSPSPFLRAKSLHVGVELWPLVFSRKLHVTGLTIDQPEITLLQSATGDWSFSNLGARPAAKAANAQPAPPGKAGLDLSVNLVKITGGRLSLGKTGRHAKPLVLEKVDAELRNFSAGSVFPFSLSMTVAGGGDVRLDGKAGPIDPVDVIATPVSAALNIAKLDLAGSGLNEAAPGVAGLISFEGSGDSNGKSVQVKGRIRAERLKLVSNGTPAQRPVEFNFDAEHDLKKHTGVLRRGDIHIGGASAALTGTYGQRGESTVLGMTLSGPNMPVPELAGMLPVMGIVLPSGASLQGGTASAKLSMEGPADRLVTSGPVSFNKTRLAGFNLSGKMSAIEKLAGIKGGPDTDIEVFSATIRMAPEGMRADDIKLVVPAMGELSGGGTVSPSNALDFKMRATVHTGGVMAMVSNTPVPFAIEGTASEPVFRPDIKAVAAEKVKSVESDAAKAAGGLLKGLLGGKKN